MADSGQAYVMVLRGSASTGPTACDGQFLERMDFEAFDGRGDLVLTPLASRAKVFASLEEAWEFWKREPQARTVRPDGKPNRPLTAMNWEFRKL